MVDERKETSKNMWVDNIPERREKNLQQIDQMLQMISDDGVSRLVGFMKCLYCD